MKVKKTVAAVMLGAGALVALGFGGAALADGGSDDTRSRTVAMASESPSPGPDDSASPSADTSASPSTDDSASPSGSVSASPSGSASTGSGSPARGEVTAEQAKAVAIRAAGGGVVESIERETEHGRLVWDVDVIVGGVEHDIDVDAATGEVTRHKTDGSDDRGRSGDDDRSGDDHGRGGDDDRGRDDHGRGGDDDRGRDDHGRGGDDDRKGDDHGRGGDDD